MLLNLKDSVKGIFRPIYDLLICILASIVTATCVLNSIDDPDILLPINILLSFLWARIAIGAYNNYTYKE